MNDCFERLKEEVIWAKKDNHLQYHPTPPPQQQFNGKGSHSSINLDNESANNATITNSSAVAN